MSKILKPLLIRLLSSTSWRKLVVLLLEEAVKLTDNDIDDEVVQLVKAKLFPVK